MLLRRRKQGQGQVELLRKRQSDRQGCQIKLLLQVATSTADDLGRDSEGRVRGPGEPGPIFMQIDLRLRNAKVPEPLSVSSLPSNRTCRFSEQ